MKDERASASFVVRERERKEVASAAASAGFTQDEIAAITEGNGGVVFRWRVLELLRQWFGPQA